MATTNATTNKMIEDTIEMPMASDLIEEEIVADTTVEEDVAEMFRNRNINNKKVMETRVAREQDDTDAAEREAERRELEAARTVRIKGRKKACWILKALITINVIAFYVMLCTALKAFILSPAIESLAHLGIGASIIGAAYWVYNYIAHEIYSNL